MDLGVKEVGEGQSDLPGFGLDVQIAGCANKMGKQFSVGWRMQTGKRERVDLRPVFSADYLHRFGKLSFHQQNADDGFCGVILAPFCRGRNGGVGRVSCRSSLGWSRVDPRFSHWPSLFGNLHSEHLAPRFVHGQMLSGSQRCSPSQLPSHFMFSIGSDFTPELYVSPFTTVENSSLSLILAHVRWFSRRLDLRWKKYC